MSELTQSSLSGLDLDLSGRQIGDFRLLRRLGRGAMAEVYLAEQLSLRRQVAFKILKRELADGRQLCPPLSHEAQAAASLVHANIVQIHEVGCVDGIHYIAQEYVPGQNLRELLARHGSPDAEARRGSVMRQVAAALSKGGRSGHRPSRHQAREHHAHAKRRGESGRFRLGPCRQRRRCAQSDADRHDDGHAALHEPRAGRRAAARPAERYLFLRRHLLPDARRPAPVSRRDGAERGGAARPSAARTLGKSPPRSPPGALPNRSQNAGQGSEGSLSGCPRTAPRFARAGNRGARGRLADRG